MKPKLELPVIRAASATAVALVLAACSTTGQNAVVRWSDSDATAAATAVRSAGVDTNPIFPGRSAAAASGERVLASRRASGGSKQAVVAEEDAATADVVLVDESGVVVDEGEPRMTVVVSDPYEGLNRAAHEFNRTMDIVLIAPISDLYGVLLPGFAQAAVRNGLENLDEPRNFVNFVFQRNGAKARDSLARFFINSTIGLAGLIDVAGRAGIPYEPTDFGMTLARSGVPEGPYLVIPGAGPSTRRDSWASVVDIAFSPTFWVGITTEGLAGDVLTGASIGGAILDTRYSNKDLIDTVIYASPDSYTTEQSIYLQRRRARIRGEFTGSDDEFLPIIP